MERPTLPLSRQDILVVDDNDDFRETLRHSLEVEGYAVLEAPDAQSALELLETVRPSLIISDISMPVMDGFRFYRALRKDKRWVRIPVIFITARDQPQEVQAGRALGVDDYLTKPIEQIELVKIVSARLVRSAEIEIAFMDQALMETVEILANAIESRDQYTRGHVERVTRYARWLGKALNWPEGLMRVMEYGTRLHDIGKLVIPDSILNKEGPLAAEEWQWIKQHPLEGAKILRNSRLLHDALPYVLYHHERWDGSGYPHGLVGKEIPVEGRIMAIVDVFDALTSQRSYHPARTWREAARYLQEQGGRDFDPNLISIFLLTLKNRGYLPDPIERSGKS